MEHSRDHHHKPNEKGSMTSAMDQRDAIRRSRHQNRPKRTYHTNESFDDLFTFLFLTLFVVLLFIKHRKGLRHKFQTAVEEADKSVLQDANNCSDGDSRPVIPFSNGNFEATYSDSSQPRRVNRSSTMVGELHQSKGFLRFSEIPKRNKAKASIANCLAITGKGSNRDGAFTISEGKLSLSSGKSYWMEDTKVPDCLGNTIQRTCVTGTFMRLASGRIIFQGQWIRESGSYGAYARFDLNPGSKGHDNDDEEKQALLEPATS